MTLLALLGLAAALEPDDHCRLQLAAGDQVEGRVFSAEPGVLVLTARDEQMRIPLVLIDAAWVEGQPVPLEQLEDELLELHQLSLERRELAVGYRRPHPALVATSSAIWPGSGHLMLGDVGSFVGYTAVELSLLGFGAYFVFVEERAGPLVPLALVDLSFRTWAVADATRTARRRRAALTLAPHPDGGAVVMLSGPLGGAWRP